MIEFTPIELSHKERVNEYLKKSNYQSCEYTFSNIYIWRKMYSTSFCELHECIIFKTEHEGVVTYSYPAGDGNKKLALETLFLQADGNYEIGWLTDSTKEELLQMFPDKFEIIEKRENTEYIYNAQDLIELKGKKYHAKRNHISKFKRNSENNHRFEPFSDDNIEYCRQLYNEWLLSKNEDYCYEQEALSECLNYYKELDLCGAMIRNNNGICAFTIGGRLNSDTFVVHVEKGLDACEGAYAVINNYFAEYACKGYTYINREDDLGIEGLRKSKLSYYPAYLLNKYSARCI